MAPRTKKKVVASPRIPGPNARVCNLQGREEMLPYDGERVLVYIEPRPEGERFEKRQREHPITGKPMFHPAPEGRMPKPVMYLHEILPLHDKSAPGAFPDPADDAPPGQFINPAAWREYVIDQSGNGTNSKNFWFRADPKVAERQEAERRRQERLNRILDRLADGEDEDEIMAEIKRKPGRPRKNPEAA